MKKVLSAVIILGSLTFVSCQKGELPGPEGGQTIRSPLPLSVGNWWAYLNYESGGAKGDTTRDTVRIVGTAFMNGKDAFLVSAGEDTSYIYMEDGYIYIGTYDGSGYLDILKFVKFPLSTGDSWVVETESGSDYSLTVIATAQGIESVRTPAGYFERTMKVEFKEIWNSSYGGHTSTDTTYTYYHFADNVGIVEIRSVSSDSIIDYSELESYNVQ